MASSSNKLKRRRKESEPVVISFDDDDAEGQQSSSSVVSKADRLELRRKKNIHWKTFLTKSKNGPIFLCLLILLILFISMFRLEWRGPLSRLHELLLCAVAGAERGVGIVPGGSSATVASSVSTLPPSFNSNPRCHGKASE